MFDKKFVYFVLISLIAIIAYSNTFYFPFHFDDMQNIVENQFIKNKYYLFNYSQYCSNALSIEEKHLCKFVNSRYIGYLSFALNYWVHGLDVRGYHITNLLIHNINAFLIYLFTIITLNTPFMKKDVLNKYRYSIALFAAILFVAHPVQTQSVTYIVQRFTSLSVLFYLLSLTFFIIWRINYQSQDENNENKRKTLITYKNILFYMLSLISSILSMKTKEIAFTLPVILLIYEIVFFRKNKKVFLFIIPFFLIAIIILLDFITIGFKCTNLLNCINTETKLQTTISRWSYFITELRVIVTYLRLIFLPINQNLDYDYPIANSFFEIQIFLSFLLILIIILFGIFILVKYKKKYGSVRIISFGIFWFFIALSIESSIFPIVDLIFEHRLYLPSVGIFITLSSTIFLFIAVFEQRWKYIKKIMIIILILLVIIFMVGTYLRNMVWSNDIVLWSDVVNKSPNKLRGYYNLAHAYHNANYLEKALDIYRKVLSIDKNYEDAYYNMANIYYVKKRYDKAIEMYNKVVNLNGINYQAYNNLGNVYLDIKEFDKALDNYNLAIRLNPLSDRIYNNRGRLYLKLNQYEKAIEDFTEAIRLNPNKASYFFNRGIAFYKKGIIPEYIRDMRLACYIGNKDACNYIIQSPYP
ncbi:MAG: tetratricopeptide repeat protein [Nitrospirae bacterium]|jgi:predicted negative regulator of RcsB-dependent stress response|nr:tetratricopeptide repeat protein [Nitrospirota bacterium]